MNIKTAIAINIATGMSVGFFPVVFYAAERENIGTIMIKDKTQTIKQRDRKGADDQYDKDESNIYISKDAVERYKGSHPADVLNQAVGVYSGDARNSGALDPNVRGIQGQGRVPVTVDGTEQAITVWRGYNGANNRNYLDPNMISSITVVKSPMLDRDLRTSTGGGVAIKTLGIDDVVNRDEKFGLDVKLETSSNSTKPKLGKLDHGGDYRDDEMLMESFRTQPKNSYIYFQDAQVLVTPRSRGNADFFNLQDNAARLAVGTRQERFNLMLAYSYRNQGNYFAGRRGVDQFKEPLIVNTAEGDNVKKSFDPYMPFAARVYGANKEVANTSSEMSSWLAKLNIQLSEAQKLSVGYGYTSSHYGEIMPLQIRYDDLTGQLPQWPLAHLSLDTFYLNYSFKPESISWLDVQIGYWLTKIDLNSNTAGGQPREPLKMDWDSSPEPSINTRLVDGIKLNQLDDRDGLSLSNKFKFTPELDMTLMGNLVHEKIGSRDDVFNANTPIVAGMFRAVPREGIRHEYNSAIKVDWRPTDWLNLNAGAQYINYWSKDTLHARRLKVKDKNFALYSKRKAKNYTLSRLLTADEYNKIQQYTNREGENYASVKDRPYPSIRFIEQALGMEPMALHDAERRYVRSHGNMHSMEKAEFRLYEANVVKWKVDHNNRLTRKTNPFYNGEVDLQEEAIDPVTGLIAKRLRVGGGPVQTWDETRFTEQERYKQPPRKTDSAWAPSFGSSIYLTDNDRVFARYLETVRMPSIFEDTVGFSGGGKINYIPAPFLAERSHTIELGYVRNFQAWLGAENHADFRLNYYNTVVNNAFERTIELQFTQVNQHKTAGLELLARYDNSRIFGDLGIDYRLKNQVCDDMMIIHMDPFNQYDSPKCTEAGFPGGYLRTQLQPKYSIHLNVGLRFFDESLEVGSRMRYHSKVENKDEQAMIDTYPYQYAPLNNSPMRWNAIFLADAYAAYQVNEKLLVELLATNILDEYYLDPLTRSMMPAPGRTFRLSVTSRF